MKRRSGIAAAFGAILLFIASVQVVFAHPGGTDSHGCHTCHTHCAKWGLKQGEYHCHGHHSGSTSHQQKKARHHASRHERAKATKKLAAGTAVTVSVPSSARSGDFCAGDVADVVTAQASALEECYRNGLWSSKPKPGRVDVHVIVGLSGKARSAKVAASELHNAEVERCVVRQIKKAHFGKPNGGMCIAKVPVAFSIGGGSSSRKGASKAVQSFGTNRVEVHVDKVTDGDTLVVRGFPGTQGKRIKVRILGMDCPESHKNSKCRRDGKQGRMTCAEQIPRGKKAAKRAASLLKHQKVYLEPGSKSGKFKKGAYGRLLAYVRLKDGRDFGLTMLKEGLCSDFGWKYPHPRGEQYRHAQRTRGE